ncbi:transposase family protein [Xenorhabdus bovienii]|uniref:transposase family protein n=1 Tax=Xenorhabdus bovienii TaxID=40576 RepID=UPI0023B22DE9|nr:transposase family protein [Xenorhabdus bovienii]MDE9456288.1 transposase family protein [Xenorhabdus bovienii]MDE9484521.1 transposase family protein [Xenorhabdus bovienii]MDE9512615.1 transposase family protein [Xenorhabdus bovienii]
MDIDAPSLHFGQIEDSRPLFKIQYPLFDILFLIVCAIIAGAEGWQNIEDYGNGHLKGFHCSKPVSLWMIRLSGSLPVLNLVNSSHALSAGCRR